METMGIGAHIARYRKTAGLTQEELGQAVGVSTQAVSRWECGGTPDVALLPSIADRLGVSIDALFGREVSGGDIRAAVTDWMSGLPEEKRLDALCDLVWYACRGLTSHNALKIADQYMDRCAIPIEEGTDSVVLKTMVETDQGLSLGIGAEDLSFMLLFPEPKGGYQQFLAPDERYRQLFSALALPGTMVLLRYLYSQESRCYTAAALAKVLGISVEQAVEALDAMEKLNLLSRQEIVLETGEVSTWMVQERGALVPFLYLAQILMEKREGFQMNWQTREKPLFVWEEEEGGRENHERSL